MLLRKGSDTSDKADDDTLSAAHVPVPANLMQPLQKSSFLEFYSVHDIVHRQAGWQVR